MGLERRALPSGWGGGGGAAYTLPDSVPPPPPPASSAASEGLNTRVPTGRWPCQAAWWRMPTDSLELPAPLHRTLHHRSPHHCHSAQTKLRVAPRM